MKLFFIMYAGWDGFVFVEAQRGAEGCVKGYSSYDEALAACPKAQGYSVIKVFV